MKHKKKILIIDDSIEFLKVMKIRFEYLNYKVFTAQDGAEGLELAKKELPDIILLDLVMPFNGFKVCEILKSNTRLKHIPVIIVSSLDRNEEVQKAKEKGANDFISKPFNFQDLLEKVALLLNKAK